MQRLMLSVVALLWVVSQSVQAGGPNVILIMSDDQGYGELGVTGNPVVETPQIDRMSKLGMTLNHFYVCPVCTPTRAGLMTGRYHYRTRAIDTFRGRAMMDPAETTVAEVLQTAGYATGIFGKWHLGDCYPMRPQDQGFEASLVHRGGGIGQPSDPPGAEGKYTDPVLFRNGHAEQTQGYCTDVYFREGLAWARQMKEAQRPFFLYLPTNAPHGPFADVPPELLEKYRGKNLKLSALPETAGHPIRGKYDEDTAARVYAMVENIDQNVGRVFEFLAKEQLEQETLVIYLTDNGRATPGFNSGFRGTKATVYEGGIRSPLYAVWKGHIEPVTSRDEVGAYIDLFPTVLEVCGVKPPEGLAIDGRSLWRLLSGQKVANWERTLAIQAHRGDAPDRFHNFALLDGPWKLLSNSGFGAEKRPSRAPAFELYNLTSDPFELKDVAAENPMVVNELKAKYSAWFDDVGTTRPDNYAAPDIVIGTPHENPTILTRQDWRGAGWQPNDEGYWDVELPEAGTFLVTLRYAPAKQAGKAWFEFGNQRSEASIESGSNSHVFNKVTLEAIKGKLKAAVIEGEKQRGVMFVEVERVKPE